MQVPLSMLFGDLPISNMVLDNPKINQATDSYNYNLDLPELIQRVLSHQSVTPNTFLINMTFCIKFVEFLFSFYP